MAEGAGEPSALTRAIEPIFDIFKKPEVAVSIAIGIVAVGLLVIVYYLLRHWLPTVRALSRARSHIRSINGEDRCLAFREHFAEADELLSSEKKLRHGWEEFKETLIIPNVDEPGPIRNTARPSYYINLSSIAAELNLPFYQALPNYFVGIGLIFTFLGLVAALHFASEGVAAAEVKQAQASLKDLLVAATFKFSTSIAGLLSSLVASIIFRLCNLGLQKRFDDLCLLLEQRLSFVTHEAIAFEQVRELRRQTLQLERFNTDFAVQVAQAIEDKLTARLGTVIGDAMQPMKQAIEGISRNFGEMNQDALSKMIGDFRSSLSGAVGNEMNTMTATLAKLESSLTGLVAGLGSSGNTLNERLLGACESLERAVATATGNLSNGIEGSAQTLRSIMEEASSELRREMGKISGSLDAALTSVGDALNSKVNEAGTSISGQVGAAANALKDAVGSAGAEMSSRFASIASHLENSAKPLGTELGRLEATLNSLDGQLGKQFETFDNVTGGLGQILTGLGDALTKLQQASDPIRGTADRFGQAANQIDVAGKQIAEANTELVKTAASIHEVVKLVEGTWHQYRQRFEKVDEDLTSAFGKIQEGTEGYHRRILEFVQEVDQHFTNAAKLLGGGIQELRDAVEDLSENAPNVRAAE